MKTICSIHEQAYDAGEHCPYCDAPEPVPDGFEVRPFGHGVVTTTYFDMAACMSILKHYYGGQG